MRPTPDRRAEDMSLKFWFERLGRLSMGWGFGFLLIAGGGVASQWQSTLTTAHAASALKESLQQFSQTQSATNQQTSIQIGELQKQTAELAQQTRDINERLGFVEKKVYK